MSPIVLGFLGAPHIERDGVSVHVARRKAIALLAYLAVTEQSHGRDSLAALFWPESSQSRARANLRHALYTLNDALGPGCLDSKDELISLPANHETRVDVVRYRRLCGAPIAHNHTYPHLCEACIQSLSAAASLYRGEFLAGFAVGDAPEFETWQLLQRESLQRELSGVLDQLANVYAEAGRRRYDLAIAYGRRWLALDELNEAAHRTLMRLYAESGDRGAAVRQYEECEAVLREELNVGPEAETAELIGRIRSGEQGWEGSEERGGREGEGLRRPEQKLPAQATTFIGRGKELEQIRIRLSDPDCRLLTIVGPGGSGKTRLAIEAAGANGRSFRDGVRFVDMSVVEAPELLATAIERGLEMPEMGPADVRKRLSEYLGPKQMLLVLDNLEHLLEGVELLPELLHAAPELKMLVTSRERLNVREEWLSPLEGLTYPARSVGEVEGGEGLSGRELEGYEAAELFVNRMRKLRPNYVGEGMEGLGAGDARAIGSICRMLEGMPLAIELAAGWTRTLTLERLEGEIRESLDVLSGTLRDVPARLRSMRAAFDHSWRLLTGVERDIMRQMSVFRGGCTLEAAEAVTGASARELAGLVDKSWLRMREGGRYTVHELARQYCEEKLATAEKSRSADPSLTLDAVRGRHCAYYGPYITGIIGTTNYRPATLGDILDEFGNLRAALHTAVVGRDTRTAASICWSMFYVGDMMGWHSFTIQYLGSVVPLLEEQLADPRLPRSVKTDVAHVLAVILHTQFSQFRWLGLHAEADLRNRRLIGLAEEMLPGRTRTFWRVLATGNRSTFARESGDFAASRRFSQEELDLIDSGDFHCILYGDERGNAFWRSGSLFGLALAARELGDYDVSASYLTRSISLREETGEQRFKGVQLGSYSQLALTMGDDDYAVELAREGLRLSELYGDRIGAAAGHLAVGMALTAQGRYDGAQKHLITCLETGRHSGRIDLVMCALAELSRIDLVFGRLADAQHRLDDALAALEQAGAAHNNALAGIWLGKGWIALSEAQSLNQCEAGRTRCLAEARHMFEKAQDERGVTAYQIQESSFGQAQVLAYEGKVTQAEAILRDVAVHSATADATRRDARRALNAISVPVSPDITG